MNLFRFKNNALMTVLPLFVATFFIALANGSEYVASTWVSIQGSHQLLHVMFFMLCFWLPTMTIGPFMGVIVDRFCRRSIYLAASAGGIVLTGGFAILFTYSHHPLWLWPGLLIGMGTLFSLRFPANNALIQELTQPVNLLLANTIANVMFELGNLLGNASGGFLIAFMPVSRFMWLVCLCFTIATLCACRLQKGQHPVSTTSNTPSFRAVIGELKDGLIYLHKNRTTRCFAIVQMLLITCFMTSPVLLAPFVKNTLHQGASSFGFIETILSVGFILGSTLLTQLQRWLGDRRCLLALLVLMGAGIISTILSHTVMMAAISYGVIGFSFAAWSLTSTLLIAHSPASLQGRIQSLVSTTTGLMMMGIYSLMLICQKSLSTAQLYLVLLLLTILVAVMIYPTQRFSTEKKISTAI